MGDDEWDDLCGKTIAGEDCLSGEFELADGRRFATYQTAYGDGMYPCNTRVRLSVDSGSIGCILASDIKASKYASDAIDELGVFVDFAEEFETGSLGGVIWFGKVKVDTAAEFDDDEDWDEWNR